MKRTLLYLPLLGISPLGDFLTSYLDGAGIIPNGRLLITDSQEKRSVSDPSSQSK
jgi:hypothetical protein